MILQRQKLEKVNSGINFLPEMKGAKNTVVDSKK